jgi:peptidoglycan/xylan/chitin deacetylase (PgdA/CDA1 family)
VIRTQTILVLLLVGAVLLWGVDPGVDEAASRGEAPALAARPDPTGPPVVVFPTATPGRADPSPPTPEPTATQAPAPTETPLPEPTVAPTEAPVATERPDPPATGQERSLIVERGDSGRMDVAFTFDAGEGAGHTEEILDLLVEYGAVASFGVTGEWVEANPDLVRRMIDEGHMVVNHTYDHSSFTGISTGLEPLDAAERARQIEDTEAAIVEATGGYASLPYFRFPYGDYDVEALDLLGELGYSYTLWWSCDSLGWMDSSPSEIIDRCGVDGEGGGPGAIILMHVANDNDWAAFEPLLQHYLEAGYTPVTMEQIIQP